MTGPGIEITHAQLHRFEPAEVVARPDICRECRGALVAAIRNGSGYTPAEQTRDVDPPTYQELMRRAGAPHVSRTAKLEDEPFDDRMARHGSDIARERGAS